MISSSHEKSNRPSDGSSQTHENSAIRTTLNPASFISRMSVSQRDRGQCSG